MTNGQTRMELRGQNRIQLHPEAEAEAAGADPDPDPGPDHGHLLQEKDTTDPNPLLMPRH